MSQTPRKFQMYLHNEAAQNPNLRIKEECSAGGPANNPTWTAKLDVNGLQCQGQGSTRQDARDAASAWALKVMGYDLTVVPAY